METDPQVIKEIYDDIQELVTADAPSIYLLSEPVNGGMTAYYQFSHVTVEGGLIATERAETSVGIPMLADAEHSDSRYLARVDLRPYEARSHWLTRSTVWADEGRTTALLGAGGASEQYEVTFNAAGDLITVWIEFEGGTAHTESFLTLAADAGVGLLLAQQPQQLPDAPFQGADVAKFVNKTELVIGFAGHRQAGIDDDNPSWQVNQNAGVVLTARELAADKQNPKPVMLFPENPRSDANDPFDGHLAQCGTGVTDPQSGAEINVKTAFVSHGADKLAIYGYSHGGGSVWILSRELNGAVNGGGNDPLDIAFRQKWPQGTSKLLWTGYIDAVRADELEDLAQEELRLPFLTQNHFNRYQDEAGQAETPNGDRTHRNSDGTAEWVPGANFRLDQNNTDNDNHTQDPNPADANWNHVWAPHLTHATIDTDEAVRKQLIASLRRVLG